MVFDIVRTIKTQSIERFSLNQTIDEICSFNRPSWWNFCSLYLNLLCKDVFSNFSSVSSSIWSSSKHAFVSYYSHCEVIYCNSMRLLAHYFWSHIARSSWGVFWVIWVPNSSNSKVSDLEITVDVKYKIFRLYISVEDALLVKIF